MPDPLVERIAARLIERDEQVALAESVTGGAIAARLTAVAGASRWFAGGVVAYTLASKTTWLDLDPSTADHVGVVSEPVAEAMARGAAVRTGAAWALASTGYAGPSGGTEAAPLGTVWLALAHDGRVQAQRVSIDAPRARIIASASEAALQLLADALDAAPP